MTLNLFANSGVTLRQYAMADPVTSRAMSEDELDRAILRGIEAGAPSHEGALWILALRTLALSISGGDPNFVEPRTDASDRYLTDVLSDGHPVTCGRGLYGLSVDAFAEHRVRGAGRSVYDPVASTAAVISMMERTMSASALGHYLHTLSQRSASAA